MKDTKVLENGKVSAIRMLSLVLHSSHTSNVSLHLQLHFVFPFIIQTKKISAKIFNAQDFFHIILKTVLMCLAICKYFDVFLRGTWSFPFVL